MAYFLKNAAVSMDFLTCLHKCIRQSWVVMGSFPNKPNSCRTMDNRPSLYHSQIKSEDISVTANEQSQKTEIPVNASQLHFK